MAGTSPTDGEYAVTVTREFIGQHFLTVPDPGPEGECHSHSFTAEVTLSGPDLNEYGYLVDIDVIRAAMDDLIERYCDTTLNDLPEFDGLNPSVEHFSRIFCHRFVDACEPTTPTRVRVTLWEDETARAAYETVL